jgi:drug/metabolite transporter (DMT)-like permease
MVTRVYEPGVRATLGVAVGVATVSTAAVLVRLAQAGVHSLVVAAWRLTLATLFLAPFALATRRAEMRRLARRDWWYVLGAGFALALHFAAWIASLAHTSVAASVVLVTANPLFVGLASFLFLRSRPARRLITGLVVATIGGLLIGLGDVEEGGHRLIGDALALVGAVGAAGYFLVGRHLRVRLSLLAYVFPVYGVAAAVLMGSVLLAGLPLLPPDPRSWLWLLLLALGPQILGHSSLNWALRYLSATYVTLAVLGESVGSTLLAWWLLREEPSSWALAGGVLILAGIAIGSGDAGSRNGTPG